MRDRDLTSIRKSALALLFVMVWTSVALGGQIGIGVKLHTEAESETAATFITLSGTFNYVAIDGGILWDSLESLGDSSSALLYFGQARLRVPILDILVPYAAVGVEAITIPSLGSTQGFLLAVGGVELSLSERGIPFSIFAEMNWTSPLETIQFGEAMIYFGFRVDLFTLPSAPAEAVAVAAPTAAGDSSVEAVQQPFELEPLPCASCKDDEVLRRWRQDD
ncbi:hypothetical protein JW848_08115 [Candidatus Bipolaricaulota bacterium]|nr:hypothetical protein [Candidatus Bipolaricaulota bacterium]